MVENSNEPINPVIRKGDGALNGARQFEGLTKREWFVCMIASNMAVSYFDFELDDITNSKIIAEHAIKLADELLERLR